MRRFNAQIIVVAILQRESLALEVERGDCVYIDGTARSVSPEERALCTTDNLHTLDIKEIKVIAVLVEYRHLINIQPHHRLVYSRSEATYIYRRCHA